MNPYYNIPPIPVGGKSTPQYGSNYCNAGANGNTTIPNGFNNGILFGTTPGTFSPPGVADPSRKFDNANNWFVGVDPLFTTINVSISISVINSGAGDDTITIGIYSGVLPSAPTSLVGSSTTFVSHNNQTEVFTWNPTYSSGSSAISYNVQVSRATNTGFMAIQGNNLNTFWKQNW